NSTTCDMDNFNSLCDDDIACVFVTHYHVNEPRLLEIGRLCRERGIYLFDDCAIAFGGSLDGKSLGVLTDASVFSFSFFKALNFFWGGMITTRDPKIAQFLGQSTDPWPRLRAQDYMGQLKACLKYDLASRPLLFNTMVFPMFQRRARNAQIPVSLEHVRIDS